MKKIGGLTLQAIQDLPLSKMHQHMRKHVDPKWQAWSKTDGKLKTYDVTVELTTSDMKLFKVEAHSDEEAQDLAENHIEDNYVFDDYEIYRLEELKL